MWLIYFSICVMQRFSPKFSLRPVNGNYSWKRTHKEMEIQTEMQQCLYPLWHNMYFSFSFIRLQTISFQPGLGISISPDVYQWLCKLISGTFLFWKNRFKTHQNSSFIRFLNTLGNCIWNCFSVEMRHFRNTWSISIFQHFWHQICGFFTPNSSLILWRH